MTSARIVFALVTALLCTREAPAAPLTAGAPLAGVYDSILGAQFDQARERLTAACPPAPAEACLALAAAITWWQIQLDPDNRALDRDIENQSARALAAAAAWTTREPKNAEAWFYLAGAHAPITQWRLLRGQRLSAARDARRVKDALERAIAIDPSLHDAYFGIGLYHYYADVAPAALKFLRVLLLMPGGNRVQGMQEMLQARNRGVLLSGEADYQMHYLYLWYEHDTTRALELLRSLDARYPSNPAFLQRIAEVERIYRKDGAAATAAWRALLTRAVARALSSAPLAEGHARLGLADELIASKEPAAALDVLGPLLTDGTNGPYGARARAEFTAARAWTALGDRSRALAALDRAIAQAPKDDPHAIRSHARALRTQLRSTAR